MRTKIRITRLLQPYWHWLAIAFVAVLAEGAMDLLEPWPLKIVFDNVIGSKKMPATLASLVNSTVGQNKLAILEFAALSVIVIAVTGAIASYAEKYLTTKVGQRVMHDLRHTLYHHIQRLSLSYYEQQKTGDLMVRITSDIDAVQDFVSSALLGIVIDVITLVGMLCVMFYLDWDFTLIALSVAPLLFFVVYSYTHRIKKATRAVKKKEGEIASVVQESLTSMRVIKAFAREDYEEERLDKESLETARLVLDESDFGEIQLHRFAAETDRGRAIQDRQDRSKEPGRLHQASPSSAIDPFAQIRSSIPSERTARKGSHWLSLQALNFSSFSSKYSFQFWRNQHTVP